jgi:sRNA-binding carbon storage regulator CsrA
MPLALTRSPGQAVLFTGAVKLRLEVLEVYRYHVVLQIGEQIQELRAGRDLHVTPELMLQLSGISGRHARIAITAPPSVHVLREELQQRHTVRRDATGDYLCSCGAAWDYRDGVEHP